MIDLVLLGDADGGSFAAAVAAAFSKSFTVLRPGAQAERADFFLTEAPVLSPGAAGSILLCKNSFSGDIPQEICPPDAVGILRSDNLPAARALGVRRVPAVSCGMAVTDTLTFSSMAEESAAVCLQRSIPLLGGGTVEPGELPLTLSHAYGDYTLMCVVACLLLAGGWELLAKAQF